MGAARVERGVVGVSPWLPWPMSASRWWTRPVRAERLAALRIGLALILLLDLLGTYGPNLYRFYGGNSLGDPALFEYQFEAPRWYWSLLHGVTDPLVFRGAMTAWIVATALLLVGFWTRPSAVVVWALSTSFSTLNPYDDNAGDQVRGIALFYLMLCPCGAAWSLDALLARRRGRRPPGPVYVYPWALRLLVVQMAVMYFCNGFFKLFGADWRRGDSLYYALNDLTLARWPYARLPIPVWLMRICSWSVLMWEISFPFVLMLPWWAAGLWRVRQFRAQLTLGLIRFLRRLRAAYLVFGVLFHLGIFVTMELGFFGPYMIALYLPLVRWERWADGRRLSRRLPKPASSPSSSGGKPLLFRAGR